MWEEARTGAFVSRFAGPDENCWEEWRRASLALRRLSRACSSRMWFTREASRASIARAGGTRDRDARAALRGHDARPRRQAEDPGRGGHP
jgi:hypothetical protein